MRRSRKYPSPHLKNQNQGRRRALDLLELQLPRSQQSRLLNWRLKNNLPHKLFRHKRDRHHYKHHRSLLFRQIRSNNNSSNHHNNRPLSSRFQMFKWVGRRELRLMDLLRPQFLLPQWCIDHRRNLWSRSLQRIKFLTLQHREEDNSNGNIVEIIPSYSNHRFIFQDEWWRSSTPGRCSQGFIGGSEWCKLNGDLAKLFYSQIDYSFFSLSNYSWHKWVCTRSLCNTYLSLLIDNIPRFIDWLQCSYSTW